MRAGWKTRSTPNNSTINRKSGLRGAQQLLIICHKFNTHFHEGVIETAIPAHNSWDEVSPVIFPHESVEKFRASVTFLKKLALDFLTKELILCELQKGKFGAKKLVLLQ